MAAWDAPATTDPSIMSAVAAMASNISIAAASATAAQTAAGTATTAEAGAVSARDLAAQYASYTQNAIESAFTAMQYQGLWNATTNSPTLASGTGTSGYFYIVGTAGSTALDGVSTWLVGDMLFFDGISHVWRRIAASGTTTVASTAITDSTAAGRALLTAASVAAQRVDLLVDQITTVADANQTVTSSMRAVAWTSLTATRTATLPAASAMNSGQPLLIMDGSGSASALNYISIARAGSDTINGGTAPVSINTAYGAWLLIPSGTNWIALNLSLQAANFTAGIGVRIASNVISSGTATRVRQTVSGGPSDANGAPNYLSTAASLTGYATTGVSTGGARLVITGAAGFDDLGALDYVYTSTSNLTWPTLTGSSTLYLYVNAATGATGFTALAPAYVWGGSPSTTNGQFTFVISQMTGYLGNGTVATATPLVFIGEVTTSGSAVTAAIAYAYNAAFQTPWVTTLPTAAGAYTAEHNIGCAPRVARLRIHCNSTELGYATGDTVETGVLIGALGQYVPAGATISPDRLSVVMAQYAVTPYLPNKSTGTPGAVTAAKWDYSFYVSRGW